MNEDNNWLKLDNAGKIFPSTMNKRDPKVFRFVCGLKENIKEKELQLSLERTLELFPVYKTVLKNGLFWFYLEESNIIPIVTIEKDPVCAPLYTSSETLLFRISYYCKRINLEVYHALSDGAGAMEFLRSLVANYLKLIYKKDLNDKNIDLEYNASLQEKKADSFMKYYDKEGKKKKTKIKKAYQLKGSYFPESRIEVIEGFMSTKEIIDLAHKYNTTVTVLFTAIYMQTIQEEMTTLDKKKPVVITIPVNLRQFFKSFSARNFFGVFNVGYDFKNYPSDLESIIEYLTGFFSKKLNYEEMSSIINSYMSLEKNILIRSIPLLLKNPFLRLFNYISTKMVTASLSNVGKVKMPSELEKYIDYFSVFVSTNANQMAVVSYLDNMVVGFTSAFKNTNIQKNFFQTLTNLGIKIKVVSNMIEGDE